MTPEIMSPAIPKQSSNLPYRQGVGAVLFNAMGEVFLGRRFGVRYPNAWQMPQGGIDDGETPAAAVLRELEEETGTAKAEIIAEKKDWLSYDLPNRLVGVSWGGKYRGQTQKWFALRFTGADADFNLEAHDHPEFCEWRWVDFSQLPDLAVPFKRRLYGSVLREFSPLVEKIVSRP